MDKKIKMTRREALLQADAHGRIEGFPDIKSQPSEEIDGAEAERRILAKYTEGALARGGRIKEELIEEAGGILNPRAAAELLGISPQVLQERDDLIAVKIADGDLSGYPAFRFKRSHARRRHRGGASHRGRRSLGASELHVPEARRARWPYPGRCHPERRQL